VRVNLAGTCLLHTYLWTGPGVHHSTVHQVKPH
jgi:hypothetical protein